MLHFMISKIKGIVIDKETTGAVLDVKGVGYDVFMPLSTIAALPSLGSEVSLWIHTHVREDELKLFGFSSKNDRTAFRTMLKVSGVGPKVALAVLGTLSGDQLASAVNSADSKRLTSVPGIGKKTAERIILELGGKLVMGEDGKSSASPGSVFGELSSALSNLGFKPASVDKVVKELEKNGSDRPFEILLREGLALLQKA